MSHRIEPIRCAVSGLGRRAWTTYLPLFAPRSSHAARTARVELCAVVDADPHRLTELSGQWPAPIPTYRAEDFARMLAETRPDWVILTTPDDVHHPQILAALAAGVSVVSEKPMVINAAQAREILAATGARAQVRVAHNLRFLNLNMRIKTLLREQRLGRVTHVDFAYHLTRGHAGSYFRRWHRHRAVSGGLSVTKSCHHFDLLNWWLDDIPVSISAQTSTRHFPAGAPAGGEPEMAVPPDADIEDTIEAHIRYAGGALATYTLTSCAPWEGYTLIIRGTEGSLEVVYDRHATEDYVLRLRLCPVDPVDPVNPVNRVSRLDRTRRVRVPREPGRHSGADERMTCALFGVPEAGLDPFACLPGARQGALAAAIGDAVGRSSALGTPLRFHELLPMNDTVTLHGEPREAVEA